MIFEKIWTPEQNLLEGDIFEEGNFMQHPILPEDFIRYQDLYWKAIDNGIDFEDKKSFEDYLDSQNFSLIEFSDIQSELEITDFDMEAIEEKLKEIKNFMDLKLSEEEVAKILEETQGSDLIDFTTKAREQINNTLKAVEKSLMKRFGQKFLKKKNKKESVKDSVKEDLKSQYFLIAELLDEVGAYLEKSPKATQRELVMKFITPELKSKLSKIQMEYLIKGFYKISEKQKSIDKFFEKNKENPNRALEEIFGLNRHSLSCEITIEKGIGTIRVYPENFDDYSRIMKDKERATHSLGFATSKTRDKNLRGVFTVIRRGKNDKSTINHEDRHQHNKLTMVENIFSKFIKRSHKSKFENFLHRAKDEIIAQFRGENESIEQIISFMTKDEGSYDYYYETKKQNILHSLKQDLEKVRGKLRAESITNLKKDDEFKFEILDDLSSAESIEKVLKMLESEKKKMLMRIINRLFNDENRSSIHKSQKILKDINNLMNNIEKKINELKNIKSGGLDWEKHKFYVTAYIRLASEILKENPKKGYNLLSVTPMEQWGILLKSNCLK